MRSVRYLFYLKQQHQQQRRSVFVYAFCYCNCLIMSRVDVTYFLFRCKKRHSHIHKQTMNYYVRRSVWFYDICIYFCCCCCFCPPRCFDKYYFDHCFSMCFLCQQPEKKRSSKPMHVYLYIYIYVEYECLCYIWTI